MKCPDCVDMSDVEALMPCPRCACRPMKCVKEFWIDGQEKLLPIFHCECGWAGPYQTGFEVEQWNMEMNDNL